MKGWRWNEWTASKGGEDAGERRGKMGALRLKEGHGEGESEMKKVEMKEEFEYRL